MEGLQKKKGKRPNLLADTVFSWSLDDVHNERLYKNKVQKIPESFQSVEHYFGCYLLEATRAQVQSSMETIYRAPYAQVVSFDRAKPYGKKLYNIRVDYWRNRFNDRGREPYKTLPGDLFALANAKPETVSDLHRLGRSWVFGFVTVVSENETRGDTTPLYFKVKASKDLEVVKSTPPLFMVFLVNLIPNGRIWKALHMSKNLNIIEEVLCTKSVAQKNLCSDENTDILNKESVQSSSSGLNESQTGILLACLEMLHSFIVKMVTAVESKSLYCSLTEVLLFGNKKRLKVGSNIGEIYLDFRLKRLVECLGPQTVSRHCFTEFTPMIDCLEDGVSHYCTFLETELTIEKDLKTGQLKAGESNIVIKVGNDKCKAYFEFIRDRFVSFGSAHRYYLSVFCTRLAKHNISVNNIQNMVLLIDLVDSFESLFCQGNASQALKDNFFHSEVEDISETCADSSFLQFKNRRECLKVLHELFDSLSELDIPDFMKQEFLMTLCFQSAFLMFCTVSSSYKLHKLAMDPLSIVVIDDAVELKECESAIPLQLPGLKQGVPLIDECQLPAILKSIVHCSDNFLKSFKNLMSVSLKSSVLNVLLKLASGWRPKMQSSDSAIPSLVKKFKVEDFYIVCTTDISKDLRYIQVLKIWDILPIQDVPTLINHLDSILNKYTHEYINLCMEKCLEGDLEVPMSWPSSLELLRFKELCLSEIQSNLVGDTSDGRSYAENSESLLLMKFYSLSSGVVDYLLSDHEGRELDLPFEVTDQEMEIILFRKSSFIVGRSGTGKTTVLTMKLFQIEQWHQLAVRGCHISESSTVEQSSVATEGKVLRQLFVTMSPKLCYTIKQQVLHLKRFSSGRSHPSETSLIDMVDFDEDEAQFNDLQDLFHEVPPHSYPLFITLHKFLIMLDGTLGNSYFERFLDVTEVTNGPVRSSRSIALQAFKRTKEVTFEKFSSLYWLHFNTELTKKLDATRVFTEMISHIKGGLGALDASDGKCSRDCYVKMSNCASNLSEEIRENVYRIFQAFEKLKMECGEFDLADFVTDLQHGLRHEEYKGDHMDFVYIDEVQDLTMSQFSLFKHMCHNVEEGFVFSGDTAQTIARGIVFRFQELKHLFYKKFVLESRSNNHDESKEKGQITEILHLTQNFCAHAGILKLSQSIVEFLYRFFPESIDVLKPESSLIYGEAPGLLESGENENAIANFFGNSGNVVGFGAEQVILVRDDSARNEIANLVGKHALVLTIVKCKGLEFQDVLLYNFLGSSPSRNQWRVIYDYMNELDLLDRTLPRGFPSFNVAKHNILCSELKQLYVAVTRTRQRLWICENFEELSKPMFDYRKKKCLVQVKKLDDSLAHAMQVASSPEEWKSCGMKLYHEHNYEMDTMCFERAGDTYWQKRSKAAGIRSLAGKSELTVDVELKECESTPLQLPSLKQAVLLIVECQLPTIVKSIDSNEAGFGRGLFEGLCSVGHSEHLLYKQYRRHPSRSFFPSSSFYDNLFLAAPILKRISHEEKYLKGSIFGRYSFVNVTRGREEKDENRGNGKKMVDIAFVAQIQQNLYKESVWETLVFSDSVLFQDSFHEVPPQYTKGSCHGTTIFWVQLQDRVIVGVDSLQSQEWIGNKSVNYRRYEVMISGDDKKFLPITNEVYATLCGDMKRCLMMLDHVTQLKNLFVECMQIYAANQGVAVRTEPTLMDVGDFACDFFIKNPIKDPTEKESTVHLCAWMPLLEEYNIILVGDLYKVPKLITQKVFGCGSGSFLGLRQLASLEIPIDEDIVLHKLTEATTRDPYTGGYLDVWTLFRGTCTRSRHDRLIHRLRHPVYANMLFEGKSMFVIIRSIHGDILTPLDLLEYLSRFDAHISRPDILWLCFPVGYIVYHVRLSSQECCDRWFDSCREFRRPIRRQRFTNIENIYCEYYLTYATTEMFDRAQRMQFFHDLADRRTGSYPFCGN